VTNGRTLFLTGVAALLVLRAAGAQAADVCEQLRADLADAPRVISNSSDIRKYASAITRQNFEIRKVRHDLQVLGCDTGSIVIFDGGGKSACLELADALDRMEDNRRILEDKRDSLRGGDPADTGAPTSREALIAALDVNGCNAPPVTEPTSPPPEGMPPETYGEPRGPAEGNDARSYGQQPYDGSGLGTGGLRTLCVRTCDGAFFPISANTAPVNFHRDAQICEQMCPGTQTELYYHSIRDQESADMVSAQTGKPYRQLPSAFAYLNRPSGEKSECGCNLTAYYEEMRQRQSTPAKTETRYSSITHRSSPAAPAQKLPDAPLDPRERPYDATTGRVRQVGPIFIPPETSSIDLRRPATPGAQPIQQ